MREIHNEIEIKASAAKVWSLLTDFPGYSDWNPFIVRASGHARVNTELSLVVETPGGREMRLNPRVLRHTRVDHLTWVTGLPIPWLYDREVSFDVEPLGEENCKLVQTCRFRGLLVPMRPAAVGDIETGYGRMLQALKTRAELSVKAAACKGSSVRLEKSA